MPAGFRIDWRGTDEFFGYDPSLARQLLDQTERSAHMLHDVTRLVALVIGWWAIDGARRLRARAEAAYRSGKRALPFPHATRGGDTWIVMVNLSAQPGFAFENFAARLKDATVEMQAATARSLI